MKGEHDGVEEGPSRPSTTLTQKDEALYGLIGAPTSDIESVELIPQTFRISIKAAVPRR
jgi:hypothetical protein